MTKSITSLPNQTVSPDQKRQLLRFVLDAMEGAANEAVEALLGAGNLNRENVQQVLGSGKNIKFGGIKFLQELIPELAKLRTRCLSLGQGLTLKPTDGKRTIAKAKNTFAYINGDFTNYGTDVSGRVCSGMTPVVHEVVEDSTFEQMFGSFSADLDKLCFEQDQIIDFATDHRNWLRIDGHTTFFLFKVGDRFFVADVDLGSDGGLEVYVSPFSDDSVWSGGDRYRVVVPQLTPAIA
ncbi:MAG: hypothetical protein AAB635_01145 [Patescibacteria group bacterium]